MSAASVRLLSVRDAAEELHVSSQRVRVLIQSGRLPAQLVNSRFYVIREADLQRFAEQARPAGRPAKT